MDTFLRDQLHAALIARAFKLSESREDPQAFGSWYGIYFRADHSVRLMWDGKEQRFVLQAPPDWRDLAVKRPAELKSEGFSRFLAGAS